MSFLSHPEPQAPETQTFSEIKSQQQISNSFFNITTSSQNQASASNKKLSDLYNEFNHGLHLSKENTEREKKLTNN
jgi:hypothetical protein